MGKGGSGTVYLVEHMVLKTFRAIKCIQKNHNLYAELINEAHILKTLRHINIPIIYDIEEDEECSYIIEEYIEGISLRKFRITNPNIKEKTIIEFSIQICELIEYLHLRKEKIIYLDLKPDNILVNNGILKLIDFGTATCNKDMVRRDYALGTRGYASPEQYDLNRLDESCDIYGIGMLLYYMLTNITFNAKTDLIYNIDEFKNGSKDLKKIINKCLKYNPSQRYINVLQLKNKLLKVNRKDQKQKHLKLQNPLTISIAGAQERIGTTHIALLFTSYFNKYVTMCLYSEQDNSRTIKSIIKRYKHIPIKSRVIKLYDCFMQPNSSQNESYDIHNFKVIIKDFGLISEENLELFLEADYPIVVIGAKEWELDYSEDILKRLADYKEINYLFNFLDGKAYHKVLQNMGKYKCFRMPFVANPFQVSSNSGIAELIEELLKDSCLFENKGLFKSIYLKYKNFERLS